MAQQSPNLLFIYTTFVASETKPGKIVYPLAIPSDLYTMMLLISVRILRVVRRDTTFARPFSSHELTVYPRGTSRRRGPTDAPRLFIEDFC